MSEIDINPYLKIKLIDGLSESLFSDKSTSQQKQKPKEIYDFLGGQKLRIINLPNFIMIKNDLQLLLFDSAKIFQEFTDSSGFALHLKSDTTDEIIQCTEHPTNVFDMNYKRTQKIGSGTTLAAYVAYTREHIIIDDITENTNFPLGVNIKGNTYKSVFCFPLIAPETKQLIGVIELWKDFKQHHYSDVDAEGILNYCIWLMAAIEEDYLGIIRDRKVYLQELIDEILVAFVEEPSLSPTVILIDILSLIREAMDATGLSLVKFKMKQFSDELFLDRTVMDRTRTRKNFYTYEPDKEKSITNTVIKTGETLNLKDHEIIEFDTEVYYPFLCRNIISIPVKIRNKVAAVIEFFTKIDADGFYNHDDYLCTLALIYSTFFISYDELIKETKVKILQILSLQGTIELVTQPCIHNLTLMIGEDPIIPEDFESSFQLKIDKNDKLALSLCARQIFLNHAQELAPKNILTLNYFISLIQQLSWKDGENRFQHVVSTMYILNFVFNKYPEDFTLEEKSEMILAALCHEVDIEIFDSGYENDIVAEYFDEQDDQIYLNKRLLLVKTLLKLSRWILGKKMKSCRMKLERLHRFMVMCKKKYYFEERSLLGKLVLEEKLNWRKRSHRDLLMIGLLIVASMPLDINESTELYLDIYQSNIKNQKREHIEACGIERIEYPPVWIRSQIKYYQLFVLPWVYLITAIFPQASGLFKTARRNMTLWKEMLSSTKVWNPNDSLLKKYRTSLSDGNNDETAPYLQPKYHIPNFDYNIRF